MSALLDRPSAVTPRLVTTPRRARSLGDRPVTAGLALILIAMVALTWRKWGLPEIDSGAELTTADLIKHGAVAYRDVRYYYGPLGLYALALSFKLFGTSFATAYGFGLVQATGILATFYALGRRWLTPLVAGLATVMLIAVGFSGTAFNFVLPHTNSATFGILLVLLMLLALAHDRPLWAGVALGLVGLTRPEFLAVAAGVAAAYLIGTWRVSGLRPALAPLWRLALPGVAIPVLVFAWFASRSSLSVVIKENIWPVKFLHATGFKIQSNWMVLDAASTFGLLARGALYAGALGGLVLSVERLRRSETISERAKALAPLCAVVATAATLDLLLRAGGLFSVERSAIETEVRHLVLGESALPAIALAAAVYGVVGLFRGRPSPLGCSWPVDLALLAAAAGLTLRAFNAFTAEGSYAPYYAAPAVLVLGIAHARVAAARPQARSAVLAALALVAAGLAAYAVFGLYRHFDVPVHTARGTFMTTAGAAPGIQAAVRAIDDETTPSDRILAGPLDGGLYFMSDRRPSLYELSLLPGLLATRNDEQGAIARLRRDRVRLAVIGARDFSLWGTPVFGVDYNQVLGAYLRQHTISNRVVGTLADPAAGTNPSKGFHILRLSR